MSEATLFFSPPSVTREVLGKSIEFRAVSIKTAFRLKTIGKPLAEALAAVFEKAPEGALVNRETNLPDGNGSEKETIVEPASSEALKFLSEKKSKAMTALFDTILTDENLDVVCEVIYDSIKHNDGASEFNKDALKEFPLPAFGEMVIGVAQANKGVFGPLADLLGSALENQVKSKLGTADADEEETQPS